MNWLALESIPHTTVLPVETAPLWKATLATLGVFSPGNLQQWKERVDEDPISVPPTLFCLGDFEESDRLARIFGFPAVTLDLLPPEPALSRALSIALTSPIPGVMKQTEIPQEISRRVADSGAQVVVVLVFDGLSYEDTINWGMPLGCRGQRQPCLVDGISATQYGMTRVIGNPPITHDLFELGYHNRIGFSYWERNANALTDDLYKEFPSTQLIRVTEFDEVLEQISRSKFTNKTYVQIIRSALDHLCHHHRERPDLEHIIKGLEHSVHQLMDALARHDVLARIFVTSDHGILWYRNQASLEPAGAQRPRYTDAHINLPDDAIVVVSENDNAKTLLVGPDLLLRPRKSSEWGFHGGVSGRESLVPFLDIRLHD